MSFRNISLVASIGLLIALVLIPVPSAWCQDEETVDFVKSIQPIFEKHCLSCHGEEDPEDFRIDVKDEAMDYIESESAEDSILYEVLITDDEDELMPPAEEHNALTESQILLIKNWIDQGADWPDGITMTLPPNPATTDSANGGQSPEDPSTDPTGTADAATGNAQSAESTPNDSADEKPAVDPKTQRIYNAIGSLHPAAVHLPVGILIAAGLFALFSLRGNFVMSDCAYYCLWLGTLGAVIASLSGWWFSPMENRGTVNELGDLLNQDHKVFWHRSSGLVTTGLGLLVALFASSSRSRNPDDGTAWKLGVILLAGCICWVGKNGGTLTHGRHHYDDLKAVGEDWFPGVFGIGDNAEEPNENPGAGAETESATDQAPESNEGSEDSSEESVDGDDNKIGETSDESES